MTVKKGFALLLALCLLMTCVPALAAPTRDPRAVEVTVDEKLTDLTRLIVNAALLQGMPAETDAAPAIPELAKDAVPSDLLVNCALAWGITEGSLPYDAGIGEQDTIALPADQAEELYRQVFTNADYAFPTDSGEETEVVNVENWDRTWYAGGMLNIAFAPLCQYGVYIYSATFDGTDAEFLCDVYTAQETELSVEEIPEDELVWSCNARVSLRSAPEAAFGYTVNGVSVSPFYQAGDLSRWTLFENADMQYDLNLPPILGVADDSPAFRVWQTADGTASLTISVVEGATSLEEAGDDYWLTHAEVNIVSEPEFDRFSVTEEGRYELVTTGEGTENLYVLTLVFPPELQAEYEFYAEIIRNSLSVWGLSNG